MTLAAPWSALLAATPSQPWRHDLFTLADPAHEAALVAAGATKAPRAEYAVIDVRGADATVFLHAQFSGDCRALVPGHSILTAWCSPKGRVLFLLHLLRHADGYLVLLPCAQAAAFTKRLRMYVLRAAVTITDCSATHGVISLQQPSARAWPALATDVVAGGDGHAQWLVGTLEAVATAWNASPLPAIGNAGATLAAIRRGEPWLASTLTDEFLPQELNLDVLDGVSFDKGCYPGQEIVARVRYRGSVKRRALRFHCAGADAPAPGARIVDAGGQAVGTVLVAAPSADGCELLVVTALDHAAPLTLADSPSALLVRAELPYAIAS